MSRRCDYEHKYISEADLQTDEIIQIILICVLYEWDKYWEIGGMVIKYTSCIQTTRTFLKRLWIIIENSVQWRHQQAIVGTKSCSMWTQGKNQTPNNRPFFRDWWLPLIQVPNAEKVKKNMMLHGQAAYKWYGQPAFNRTLTPKIRYFMQCPQNCFQYFTAFETLLIQICNQGWL